MKHTIGTANDRLIGENLMTCDDHLRAWIRCGAMIKTRAGVRSVVLFGLRPRSWGTPSFSVARMLGFLDELS
jgi:hypothetical protein